MILSHCDRLRIAAVRADAERFAFHNMGAELPALTDRQRGEAAVAAGAALEAFLTRLLAVTESEGGES